MPEKKRCSRGEVVRVAIDFQHVANIYSIEATFQTQASGDNREIVLESENRDPFFVAPDNLTAESTATAAAYIFTDQAIGDYTCESFTATTVGGKTLIFSTLPNLVIEVVPERQGQPTLKGFRVCGVPLYE